MNKLDEIYLRPEHKSVHAFKEFFFSYYKRDIGVNTNDLVHYKFLYQILQKFEMTHPNGVQAFLVLNAANLSNKNEKLSRATCVM